MTGRLLFVGEQPSKTAIKNGWTWESGRLAAKSLFDALRVCGVDPTRCGFVNLFGDSVSAPTAQTVNSRIACLRAAAKAGLPIVAMGNKVSSRLRDAGVEHVTMRHPAARGAGRRRDLYAAHVRAVVSAAQTVASVQ